MAIHLFISNALLCLRGWVPLIPAPSSTREGMMGTHSDPGAPQQEDRISPAPDTSELKELVRVKP